MKRFGQCITLFTTALGFSCALNASSSLNDDHVAYCEEAGGIVEQMAVQFGSTSITGEPRPFCNFHAGSGFAVVGLDTFASDKPSIAATYIKELGEISPESPLWKGDYFNPSTNVCKNLGGASVGFVSNGGFANELGQSDVCVFGDGSMVSGWTLIYIANGRDGYEGIREYLNSQPLPFKMPA